MPVEEAPDDDEVRQSYNFAPGYHGLVYRADTSDTGGKAQDKTTDKEVRDIIQEVMHGRTIIEVTHRLDHVTDFDIAVIMENGRIIETGEPRELLTHESALKALRG